MSTLSLPFDLTDAIASANNPAERAAVIVSLVSELYETIGWVLALPDSPELASLRRVVEEARSHQERILQPAPGMSSAPVSLSAMPQDSSSSTARGSIRSRCTLSDTAT